MARPDYQQPPIPDSISMKSQRSGTAPVWPIEVDRTPRIGRFLGSNALWYAGWLAVTAAVAYGGTHVTETVEFVSNLIKSVGL